MGRHEIFDSATSIPALNSMIGSLGAEAGIAQMPGAPADAEPAQPDPILATIEIWRAHDAALTAFNAQVRAGSFIGNKLAEEDRLVAERSPARDAVLATVPTTAAGRAALVQFVRHEIDASGMADGGPPDDDHPIWRDGLRALLAAQEAELRADAEALHPGLRRAVYRQGASPDLIAMVERWQALLGRINGGGITDAEVEQLRELHDDLQRAIYNFPAASIADLLAKVPAFRDELYNATGSLDERDDVKDDLSGAAWFGLFRDFERLASIGGAVAASEGVEPESAAPRPAFRSDAHPDAALLALAATLPALISQADAALEARGAAETAVHEMVDMPVPVKPRDIQLFLTSAAYHEAMRQWDQDCQERACRRMRAEQETNFADLEDAAYETEDAVHDTCEMLAGMRATTLAGVIAKARFAERGNWDQLSRSIVADLVAMGVAEDHLRIAPPLSDQIIACWREWAALPDFEETEQGKAEFNRLSAERSALCAAAEALPVELGNVPAKALALAWLGYVDLWQHGAAREDYDLDGRLALDIDTAITGRLKTSYLEGAA